MIHHVNWIRFEEGGWFWDVPWRYFTRTKCKHGTEPCERCGTTEHRDVRHTTLRGRGCVARLREA